MKRQWIGGALYRYVRDRVVPGCSFEDEDESREGLETRAVKHLREEHQADEHDDRVGEALRTTGIGYIKPA